MSRAARFSVLAREIVAKRVLVLLGVAAVAHIVVLTGVVPIGFSEQAEAWTTSILDAVAAIGAIFWIRSGTTPADPALAPTSSNGKPLVEASVRVDEHHRNEPTGNVHVVDRGDDLPPKIQPNPGTRLYTRRTGDE